MTLSNAEIDWGGVTFAVREDRGRTFYLIEAGPRLQAQLDRIESLLVRAEMRGKG